MKFYDQMKLLYNKGNVFMDSISDEVLYFVITAMFYRNFTSSLKREEETNGKISHSSF